MQRLPALLIWSRLVMAGGILMLCFTDIHLRNTLIVVLISLGLLSDIFDGIIARKLGLSTERLRRLDSSIDQVFWITVIVSAIKMAPSFFAARIMEVALVVLAELAAYGISYFRFGKEVATHAIASKIWTLILFATMVELILTGSSFLFLTCIITGIASRLEIIAILLLLRQWTNDVPSVYHAIRIRQGKPIKRNKLFNG